MTASMKAGLVLCGPGAAVFTNVGFTAFTRIYTETYRRPYRHTDRQWCKAHLKGRL